jgi:hypothetical protein
MELEPAHTSPRVADIEPDEPLDGRIGVEARQQALTDESRRAGDCYRDHVHMLAA